MCGLDRPLVFVVLGFGLVREVGLVLDVRGDLLLGLAVCLCAANFVFVVEPEPAFGFRENVGGVFAVADGISEERVNALCDFGTPCGLRLRGCCFHDWYP